LHARLQDFRDFRTDFGDFRDFCGFKDFKDLKYSNGFRPGFKEFRSGVRVVSNLKRQVTWILGKILGISGRI